MNNLQKCLSAFAVATWTDRRDGITLADQAIDNYLEPHIEAGTSAEALKVLIQAFRNVGSENAAANAIRIDLNVRFQRLVEMSKRNSDRQYDLDFEYVH